MRNRRSLLPAYHCGSTNPSNNRHEKFMPRNQRAKERLPTPEDTIFSAEEVCRNEIDGAIDLLGRYGNYPAAHLLSSAAHANICAIAKKHDITLNHDLSALIRKYDQSKEAAIMRIFLSPYNSLKHIGSKDSKAFFKLEYAELMVHVAAQDFFQLFGTITPRMVIYSAWTMHRFPLLRKLIKAEAIADFVGAESATSLERLAILKAALITYADDPTLQWDMLADVEGIVAPSETSF